MGFEKNEPFRYWVQMALPTVYDDSLSYYELLCKVVKYLNQMGEGVNNLGDSFVKLQEYVNSYFDNLDVETEINNKLDKMAEDGKLSLLVGNYFVNDTVYGFNKVVFPGSILHFAGVRTRGDVNGVDYIVSAEKQSEADVAYNGLWLTPLNHRDNVIVWGADPSGAIDSTNAINNCIQACKMHGTVYIPNGTYVISDTILIDKPIGLYSDYEAFDLEEVSDKVSLEDSRTFLIQSTADVSIRVKSVGVTLRNLCVKQTGGTAILLFQLGEDNSTKVCRNNRVERCCFRSANNVEACVSAPVDLITTTFEQVRCIYGNYGFKIGSMELDSTSLSFQNCWCVDQVVASYHITNCSYSTISACACDAPNNAVAHGYYLDHCHNFNVINCGCEHTSIGGVYLDGCYSCRVSLTFVFMNRTNSERGGCVVALNSRFCVVDSVVAEQDAYKPLVNLLDNVSTVHISNCRYWYIRDPRGVNNWTNLNTVISFVDPTANLVYNGGTPGDVRYVYNNGFIHFHIPITINSTTFNITGFPIAANLEVYPGLAINTTSGKSAECYIQNGTLRTLGTIITGERYIMSVDIPVQY